ncbi:hypothetical protein ALC57_12201 [Trachymyrmex cornetzi]|uniref:Uncharacterized protein n=1 Tax=Trachymyrmex cornetzi TaxID=471704 RepID=A0A151J1A8_9HYME|nr:hypothetical protein ALC57_12201 [Trachymyrmex cornetzi]
MGLMSTYLSESSQTKVNSISFANIFVSFTSAYGVKAILVTHKENENVPKEVSSANTQIESAQPPTKKRKSYSVAIVMQQATFQGMERVIKCVDAHVNQLTSIIDNVNECERYLIKEIELLTNSFIDAEIIRLVFRGNKEAIERSVKTQINNLSFLEAYFNILFLELTELKFNEIVNIVLTNHRLRFYLSYFLCNKAFINVVSHYQ